MKSSSLQHALCQPLASAASTSPRNTKRITPTTASLPPDLGATRLQDFCARYRISRWTFMKLRKAGEAPRTFKVGALVFISHDAEREWLKAREQAAAEAAGRTTHRIRR